MPQPATSSAGMTKQMSASISVASSLYPAARTTTASGTGVDLSGYESATVVVQAGAWTDGQMAHAIYESDDDDTYTAADAADVVGTLATVSGAGSDEQVSVVGYVGDKRYIKVVQTITGSPSTGLVSSAVVIRGHARYTEV
jgi:hypothetical protein